MKQTDCIDACVFLGTLFENEENCENYVNTVGYKLKNKGMLTIPLLGEIFASLFLKIAEKINEHFERKLFMQNAVDFFDRSVIQLLHQQRLRIVPMRTDDLQHVEKLKELDYAVTDDDAIHLSFAINNKCQRFVTTDKVLLADRFRSQVKKEFGLIITSPS